MLPLSKNLTMLITMLIFSSWKFFSQETTSIFNCCDTKAILHVSEYVGFVGLVLLTSFIYQLTKVRNSALVPPSFMFRVEKLYKVNYNLIHYQTVTSQTLEYGFLYRRWNRTNFPFSAIRKPFLMNVWFCSLSTGSLWCHDNEWIDESPLCEDLEVDPSFLESMTIIFITPVNEIRRIWLISGG